MMSKSLRAAYVREYDRRCELLSAYSVPREQFAELCLELGINLQMLRNGYKPVVLSNGLRQILTPAGDLRGPRKSMSIARAGNGEYYLCLSQHLGELQGLLLAGESAPAWAVNIDSDLAGLTFESPLVEGRPYEYWVGLGIGG